MFSNKSYTLTDAGILSMTVEQMFAEFGAVRKSLFFSSNRSDKEIEAMEKYRSKLYTLLNGAPSIADFSDIDRRELEIERGLIVEKGRMR